MELRLALMEELVELLVHETIVFNDEVERRTDDIKSIAGPMGPDAPGEDHFLVHRPSIGQRPYFDKEVPLRLGYLYPSSCFNKVVYWVIEVSGRTSSVPTDDSNDPSPAADCADAWGESLDSSDSDRTTG